MSVTISTIQYPYSVTESPVSGTYDGSNVTFTLRYVPNTGSEVLTNKSGLTLHNGIDYTLSGSTLTMVNAPDPSDALYITYKTN